MSKKSTVLKKMHVKHFRNMHDLEIEFGKRLTVISGKKWNSQIYNIGFSGSAL